MIRDPRASPPAPSYPGYPPHSPYLRRASPPGSPKKCCFEHKESKETLFCCCYTCSGDGTTSILATLGVCCLVLAYTILGAFVFMTLEGGVHTDTAVAASKLDPKEAGGSVGDLRAETVDRLWSITENLNILYRENWTRLAAEEVLVFQEQLFKRLRYSGQQEQYASGTVYYGQHVHKWSFSSSFLYSLTLITTIATLNALPCGMQYGWSAPTFPVLRFNSTPVEITPTDEVWLESSYTLSGLLVLLCTTYLVDKIGRKYSILLSTSVSLLSWILIGTARRVGQLYLARILSGMASDMAFVAIPMYVAEIATQNLRGSLVGLNFLVMLVGVLVVYSVAPFTPYYATAVVGSAITGLQLALSPLMPPSPYHLLAKGRKEEAAVALTRLRGGRDSRRELEAIEEAVRRQNEDKGGIGDLLAGRAVAIVAALMFFQHFSGYSVVVMNLHSILAEAGWEFVKPKYAGIVPSALMLAASTAATLLVDRLGRKRLLVVSGVTTGLCLSSTAAFFSMKSRMEVKRVAWIPALSLTAYAVTFKLGLGFLPQVINAEVFPSRSKAMGMTLGDAMFIVFSSASVVFYKYVAEAAGLEVPLYVFAGVAFLSAVFSLAAVPETKGKTLDEIQGMMKGG